MIVLLLVWNRSTSNAGGNLPRLDCDEIDKMISPEITLAREKRERWAQDTQAIPLLRSVLDSMLEMEALIDELPAMCRQLPTGTLLEKLESALRRNARISLELRVVALFLPHRVTLAITLCAALATVVVSRKIVDR
eukprot:COSAG02_NODE_4_length_69935_cov_46.806590_7_plen_136_part_00